MQNMKLQLLRHHFISSVSFTRVFTDYIIFNHFKFKMSVELSTCMFLYVNSFNYIWYRYVQTCPHRSVCKYYYEFILPLYALLAFWLIRFLVVLHHKAYVVLYHFMPRSINFFFNFYNIVGKLSDVSPDG